MTPAEKLAEVLESKLLKKQFNEMVRRAEKKGALVSCEVIKCKPQNKS